jgi:hypothetical protein
MNPEWFIPDPDMNPGHSGFGSVGIRTYPKKTRLSWLHLLTNCKCNMLRLQKDFKNIFEFLIRKCLINNGKLEVTG